MKRVSLPLYNKNIRYILSCFLLQLRNAGNQTIFHDIQFVHTFEPHTCPDILGGGGVGVLRYLWWWPKNHKYSGQLLPAPLEAQGLVCYLDVVFCLHLETELGLAETAL